MFKHLLIISLILLSTTGTKLFAGKSNTKLKIDKISVVSTSNARVRIKAVLNQKCQVQLEYGTDKKLNKKAAKELSFRYSTHTLHLIKLDSNTLYYFRLLAWDRKGKQLTSKIYQVKTKPHHYDYFLPGNIGKNDMINAVIYPDGDTGSLDPLWRSFAYETKCVFARMTYVHDKDVYLKGLAAKLQHPEVAFSPWVTALGSIGARIVAEADSKTLAVMVHDSQWTAYRMNASLGRYPQGYFPIFSTAGSHDGNSVAVYEAAFIASKKGWQITSANDLSSRHCWKTNEVTQLQLQWLKDVIRLRIPEDRQRNRPVKLRKIDPRQGWLGTMQLVFKNGKNLYVDPEIYPYDKAPGDKKSYIWLPSAKVAKMWYNIIRYGTASGAREAQVILPQRLFINQKRLKQRGAYSYLDAVNTHGKVTMTVTGSPYFTIDPIKNRLIVAKKTSPGRYDLKLIIKDDFGTAEQAFSYRVIARSKAGIKMAITAPRNRAVFNEGTPVTLSVKSENKHNAEKIANSAWWYSSIDGKLGSGKKLVISNLTPGNHLLTCTVNDPNGNINAKTIEFTVRDKKLNQAPVIKPIPDQAIDEDGILKNISLSMADKNHDRLLVTLHSSNEKLVDDHSFYLYGSGNKRQLTIVPKPNANGSTVITVTVADGQLSSSASFKLNVRPVPDKPLVKSALFEILPQPGAVTLNPLTKVIDPDGDKLVILKVKQQPANGKVTIKDNRIIYRSPSASWIGNDNFQLIIVDNAGHQVTQNITVAVNKQNKLLHLIFDDARQIGKNSRKGKRYFKCVGNVKPSPGIIGFGGVSMNGTSNFNGGYLDLGVDPKLNFDYLRDSFTVLLWFKLNKISGSGYHNSPRGMLLRRGKIIPDMFSIHVLSTHTSKKKSEGYNHSLGHAKDNPDFEIWVDKGRLHCKLGANGTTSKAVINGTTLVEYDKWYLATLVNNSRSKIFKLYLNDIEQGRATTPVHKTVSNRLIVGGFETEDAEAVDKVMPYFCGELDNLIIYQQAVKLPHIKALLRQRD